MTAVLRLLRYIYVEGIAEKRQPFRAQHLAYANQWVTSGKLLLGGACGDPINSAAICFKVSSSDDVEEFVKSDPYFLNGLVKTYDIVPFHVVIGSLLPAINDSTNESI